MPDAGGQREREDQVGGGAQRAPQDPQEEQTARQVSQSIEVWFLKLGRRKKEIFLCLKFKNKEKLFLNPWVRRLQRELKISDIVSYKKIGFNS